MSKTIRILVAALAALVMTLVTAPASLARPVWDTSPVTVTHHVSRQAKTVDLRVGAHRRFDRVVIDLVGRTPSYQLRYTRQLTYDPSGETVPLRGRRFASISFSDATAHNRAGHSIYRGPTLQQYHFDTLRGVALTGDFEGVVSFGFSLSKHADFRVIELASPHRVVIDFRH